MDYGNWLGVDNWVQNVETPTPSKGKGGFLNGGNQNPMGRAPRTDPGGKVKQDSDCDLKTNERSFAKNMLLLSEFTCNVDWGAATKRWEKMLYNHPISQGVDYFINNLISSKSSLTDNHAGGEGLIKHKAKSKVEERGKALLEGKESEPISYEWAFRILRNKHQEPEGAPIVRIAGK